LCLPFRNVLSYKIGQNPIVKRYFWMYPYNCLPNNLNVVPPIGFTLRGPIFVSQTVMANCAEAGKSQYLIGKVNHSFQLF
jgi:hypothetical protein